MAVFDDGTDGGGFVETGNHEAENYMANQGRLSKKQIGCIRRLS
jgi:hypothetical protein